VSVLQSIRNMKGKFTDGSRLDYCTCPKGMSYGGSSIPLPHLIHVDIRCEATV
jgi:hypothetical protein